MAWIARERFAERLWAKDPTLWNSEEAIQRLIRNRLGWLTVLDAMREDALLLGSFADEVRRAGYTHALLLGMGGSSLCSEVLRKTFGLRPGFLDLAVLDSTDPAAVQAAERRAPLERTLFLVATKSGTTTETLCFFRYFFDKVRRRAGARAGQQFVAITDPGSPLVSQAGERGFRRVFLNPADIGGRYSALSYFGLLPAALMGIDIRALLERAAELLPQTDSKQTDDAIRLGAALGELGLHGRDKITFVLSPPIAAFGCWVEQLLAESTGKQGQGLFPVDAEPLGAPARYGRDRVFVQLRLRSSKDAEAARRLAALENAGHPVIRLELKDLLDLGREFFRWEIATAVAAAIGKTDAFDEPNVKESKDNTERLLKQFSSGGRPPAKAPLLRERGIALYGELLPGATARPSGSSNRSRSMGMQECLAAHFRRAAAEDYIAILAYLAPTSATDQLLQQVRLRLRDALGVATTVGYGPRYLHSTGQFHKGGPSKGVFLQITARDRSALRIPELPYGFSLLKQAQAEGDFEALQARHKPILRLHLESVEPGLRQLVRWVESAFPPSLHSRPKPNE